MPDSEIAIRPRSELPKSMLNANARFRRLPDWLRGYLFVLLALTAGCVVAAILLRTVGPQAKIVISLLGDVILLGAAWTGYGQGVLALTLIQYVVPRILTPEQPSHVDISHFGLLAIICLLISRISASKRKMESTLRQVAANLEKRVHERTLELQQNEQRCAWLAAMVESSDDAIVGETLDGLLTSWNLGAEALYGYRADEVIGCSASIFVPPDGAAAFSAILSQIQNGEAIRNLETVRLHKDGSRLFVSVSVSPVRDSAGTIIGISTIARDITDKRRVQEALADSEHRYRLLFENNPQPMWVYDLETLAFLTVNDTAVERYGYTRDEFLRMTLKDIRPEEDVPAFLASRGARSPGFRLAGSFRHRKKDGQTIIVEISVHPLVFGGRPASLAVAADITEKKRLEEQFRQAQRLESVGRLAGGVAHDFNNLLTVINGYSEMLLADRITDENSREGLQQIWNAGLRAADLTQQLLAFSRRQVTQPAVIDINTVVKSTETLLRRLIGEDIELVTRLSDDLGLVCADPGQMQQIIMNLAVNSRDAMQNGGVIHLETSNVMLDESYRTAHPEANPGPHVMLAVSDNGTGMSREVQARIFEPFFTTKDVGKGTGLGLAAVYGMVKQGGGTIWVYSEPGEGTTFKIYLPRTDQPLSQTGPNAETEVRGDETILVVEDQIEVRTLALAGLKAFGYSAHGAGSGQDALRFCREFPGKLDLVVTDVVMPDMNGREVAGRIALLRPHTCVLFMSGYTADVIAHRGVLDPDVDYLQKPFTPALLARKIREILARNPASIQ